MPETCSQERAEGTCAAGLPRPRLGRTRGRPAERGHEAKVLVAERGALGEGVGEGGQELVALRAGDQVIVPEDPDVALPPLNGHLVAEAAGGVALNLADTHELDEPRAQSALHVVAELIGVLVL